MGAYTDLMVDLETLGVGDNAVITQIGLVAFDLSGPVTSRIGMNVFVDPSDAMKQGQKADWSTIAWWLQQSDAARNLMATSRGSTLRTALVTAGDFIVEHTVGIDKVRPWGYGAGFDITLLEQAYRLTGLEIPWRFRNIRDLRTLADIETAYFVDKTRPVVEHDALADAHAQAEWAQKLYSAIVARQPQPLPAFAMEDANRLDVVKF